jgi:hypothetical protein
MKLTAWLALSAVLIPLVTVFAQTVHESPFVCDMSMLDAVDRARKDEIGGTLAARMRRVHDLPNGYEFVLPGDADTIRLVAEWLVTERLCCPFFDFDLRIDREGGPTALRLTGRKGTKEFIRADFGRWMK